MVKLVTTVLATMTLFGDVIIVITVIIFITSLILHKNWFNKLSKAVSPSAWYLTFFISLTALIGSLFYSEIAKYTPCVLCWYQRILMYPQVIMLYVAILKNERVIKPYLLVLNVIGILIAAYNYLIQILPKTNFLPCEAGGAVSCTKTFGMSYGYITIPMMALTAFMLNIALLIISKPIQSLKSVKQLR